MSRTRLLWGHQADEAGGDEGKNRARVINIDHILFPILSKLLFVALVIIFLCYLFIFVELIGSFQEFCAKGEILRVLDMALVSDAPSVTHRGGCVSVRALEEPGLSFLSWACQICNSSSWRLHLLSHTLLLGR